MRCHEITILSTVTHKRYCRGHSIWTAPIRQSLSGNFVGGLKCRYHVETLFYQQPWPVLGLAWTKAWPWSRRKASSRQPRLCARAKPPAPVRKAQTPDPRPGFLRYKAGDAEITALYDGIWEKVHDAKYFGNATVAEVNKPWPMRGSPLHLCRFRSLCSSSKLNGKLVLCDAGAATRSRPSIQIPSSFPAR